MNNMDRFVVPLYDYATGGPPRAWECPNCGKIVRTLSGVLAHKRVVHRLKTTKTEFWSLEDGSIKELPHLAVTLFEKREKCFVFGRMFALR